MRAQKTPLSRSSITSSNTKLKWRVEQTLKLAKKYSEDPEKKKRVSENLCIVCYYTAGRMAGNAFTNRECGSCDTDMTFSNTDTDMLCPSCAKGYKLCKHCGCGINGVLKRSKYTFETPST